MAAVLHVSDKAVLNESVVWLFVNDNVVFWFAKMPFDTGRFDQSFFIQAENAYGLVR